MESYSKTDIVKALSELGFQKGQVVFLLSDLINPGRLQGCKSKEDFCQSYLDAFIEVIGVEGTLVVPTYTTQVARFDIDFIPEETPSLMGVFSEYVRKHPKSLRSLHPLQSVAAIGPLRELICGGLGGNNFGYNSPFQRMLEAKAKIVAIGLPEGFAVPIAHFIEGICGLPYVYNKLLKWSPVINGKKDARPCYATVRYLGLGVEYDLERWVARMKEIGAFYTVPLGGSKIHMTDYETTFKEGIRLVREDPYVFLKLPPKFVEGEIPFDNNTAGRDDIASQKDIKETDSINWVSYYMAARKSGDGF